MTGFKIGGVCFREIRETACYYVDKTTFLEEFFRFAPPQVSLITRPRRFGKTLMMNMLSEFFDITRDSKAVFEGLAISKNKEICDKWMNQYPVVLISLKEMDGKTFQDALNPYITLIADLCRNLAYLQESPKVRQSLKDLLSVLENRTEDQGLLESSLFTICSALHTHWGKPVIVLIDEYDVPLARAQGNGYYDDMVAFIRKLLGPVLKDYNILKLGILTGCLRISGESFFTGLNNFKSSDISDKRYADKFGFTSDEVDALLAAAGFSDKKEEIKAWYDGYLFGKETEIYCPWDILQYVDDLQVDHDAVPKAYWKNSSRNEIVRTFVDRSETEDVVDDLDRLMAGRCVETSIIEDLTYDRLYESAENMWTVLYFSGYLTKAGPEQMEKCFKPGEEPKKGNTVLAIPNKEVLEIFADVICKWFKQEAQTIDRTDLFKAFWADDADELAELLSDQLEETISYFDARENYYHAFIAALFTFSSWYVHSNKEFGRGRPDIVVRDKQNKRAAVIEVKRARSEKGLPEAAEKAILQIKENQYAAPLLKKKGWKVSLWGMAFFKKTCMLRVEAAEQHP